MIVYDRKAKSTFNDVEEKEGLLKFLYETILGRMLLKCIVARPLFSRLRSVYQKSKFSKKDIKPFIIKYGINIGDEEYRSFNDFFIREKEYVVESDNKVLISPADAKLTVFRITDDLRFDIKKSNYSLFEIVEDTEILKGYEDGVCLIFRLSLSDYHRYIYIDDGVEVSNKRIKGLLHTVRPISDKYKVFSRNMREVTVLETKNLGEVIQVEVGALLVGCIRNKRCNRFLKGQEKGYFEYGGSTIILLLKNNVEIDEDILVNNSKGIEVKVGIGEKIGSVRSV